MNRTTAFESLLKERLKLIALPITRRAANGWNSGGCGCST